MEIDRKKLGNKMLITGISVFLLGFLFLKFVGKNYSGFWAFIAPLCIIGGIILIGVSLAI